MKNKKFPINPFIDVDAKVFHSRNKKHVTEDFVAENFKLINWDIFRPFNDTGIDLIISKKVCSKDITHTQYDDLNLHECKKCKNETRIIHRFIQIKTRELVKDILGYTLKSKDFRTDPRHIFLFYSDHSTDFLSLPVIDYLKFFENTNISHFGTPTFNQGNGKMNSLKFNKTNNTWNYAGYSWENYRNIKGINNFMHRDFDENLNVYSKKISQIKKKLFYDFKIGKTFNFNENQKEEIINFINLNIINSNKENFQKLFKIYIKKIKKLDSKIKDSANSYLKEYKEIYERTKN